MGGHIDFKSREHQGTRFWFELPLTVAENEDMPDEATAQREPEMPSIRGRILLADDSPANAVANTPVRRILLKAHITASS